MKKILSILMILILLVLFAMTYYCSRISERFFTAQINALNQVSPELFQIDLQSYQRHFFTSSAATTVQIMGKKKIIFNHQIRHFVWGIKMTTILAEILADDSAPAETIVTNIPLDQLQLITDINLLGVSQSRLELPEISFQKPTGTLKITGFKTNWEMNTDLTMGKFKCQLDNLLFQQGDQKEINLAGLKISSLLTNLQDIPLGRGELHLEKLQVAEQGKPTFEFHKIQYQGKTAKGQGSYNSSAVLNFAELFLAEEKLSNGQLKLTLSGIDSGLLHSFQQITEQLQRKALNQQISSLELQLQLLGLYTQLLHSDISLNLEKLSLDTAAGSISGTGTLTLLNNNASAGALFSLKNIKVDFQLEIDRGAFITGYRLFNNLQIDGQKKLNPALLAEQAEQIAEGLVQKGIFTRQDGDTFRVEFSLAKGQGELNGKPF